ncbi:MAG TPA: TonB-dependent receptor [Terracidiphilus sp.]|jgi:outer membrane receptor protein involved in Fe transport
MAGAQGPAPIAIGVEDAGGAAVAGATVTDASGRLLGSTDASGNLNLACQAPCRIQIAAPGFGGQTLSVSAATTVHLQPEATVEQVTVTAYRAPLGELESPAITRVLSERALRTTAAVTLDDQLRQLPGVELFRRSPSLVANPTSQGISLRGLGSTSASRTLVTEDDVPLNDPLGGWIHWEEQPDLSIRDIELVRGGASSLYGSSAIGGVINVIPMRPGSNQAEVSSSYGGEGTFDESLLAQTKRGPFGALVSGGALGTDGYIQEAPSQRGPVDVASNVHSQNALALAERVQGPLRVFVRGSGFEESRHNGTPYQFNGTRLVRYATGADWQNARSQALNVRLYGSDERYRQTFSSISNLPVAGNPACTYRCSEIPSKFSFVPDNELGAAAHWTEPLGAGLVLVAGADVHDVRVWDREQSFGATAGITSLHDHQRDSGAYAEAMWMHNAWTVTASGRMDWFQNYDGRQFTWNGSAWVLSASQPSQLDQRLFDPRMGVSRKLFEHWAVSASGFRAFRAPTPSELYRATQVGAQLTLPNGNLLSERATGWETGLATEHNWGTVRASYFLTEINRPIVALTLATNRLMRENLGQIESRGVSLDYEVAPRRWVIVDGGYQYAHAVVSRGTQDYGKWIPEVARNLATLNVRAFKPSLGTLSLESRMSGRQFDDDANAFLLHSYFRLDAYASRSFRSRWVIFAAGENLLDRSIEVSKTPTTTLGQARVARIGFQLSLGKDGK